MLGAGVDDVDAAGRAEAGEAGDRLAHDWLVVTAEGLVIEDPDECDELPVLEVPDELLPESSEALDDPPVEEEEDVLALATVLALLPAEAVSAGSCPEASWT
jgi:hypothetical protein